MTSHWGELVKNSASLSSLYSNIPPLQSVRLRSFHLNWRGPTLTARIDLPRYPDQPPAWSRGDHNTLQIHLQFLAVDDLSVHGWIPDTPVDINLSLLDESRVRTCILGTKIDFSFTCSNSLTIGHISTFHRTEVESDEVRHTFLKPLDARRYTSVPGTHESTFYERV